MDEVDSKEKIDRWCRVSCAGADGESEGGCFVTEVTAVSNPSRWRIDNVRTEELASLD